MALDKDKLVSYINSTISMSVNKTLKEIFGDKFDEWKNSDDRFFSLEQRIKRMEKWQTGHERRHGKDFKMQLAQTVAIVGAVLYGCMQLALKLL